MAFTATRQTGPLAWGRVHKGHHHVLHPHWMADAVAMAGDPALGARLAYGMGRSYGDSCLNLGGTLIETRGLDRIAQFDRHTGQLVVEAGVTLFDILDVCARPNADGSYWFPPVLPGTKFVTVGGAIANDVHGKNHHKVGTFGHHVEWLDLVRSDGSVLRCSRESNAALFAATVGGLGLTGLITRAALRLRRVESPLFDVEDIPLPDLETFFQLAAESADTYEYTVAWIDCLAKGTVIGRGIFSRARHAASHAALPARPGRARISLPLTFPGFVLNPWTLAAFNALYRSRIGDAPRRSQRVHCDPFLFPLDKIGQWNRMYGPAGFYQYQCVVPTAVMKDSIRDILATIAHARQGSFLAVLKTFGNMPPVGLLSFPVEGATLALDFPNKGAATLRLLDALDRIVLAAGGRVYPAKDGRMTSETFKAQYPAWHAFAQHIDPNFSSSFWRRVTAEGSS